MAIIQISKIQQRSGDLVDLPQLDTAEFGFAEDAKRLFIGKENPNENIEVLTSYSEIAFSQLQGSVGNLDISPVTIEDGQVLAYNGTDWVNRGGNAGGLLTFGDVSNVKIDGGAIGYVLETDGTGNLSWTPKSTIIAFIENITVGNGAAGNLTTVTTTQDNFFTEGAQITVTNVPGISGSIADLVNANTYYVDVITSNTFALCTSAGTPPSGNLDATGYTIFPYTSVTDTTAGLNEITVGNSNPFATDYTVKFLGNVSGTGLNNDTTYYVYSIPSATTIKVSTSDDGNVSNIVSLVNKTGLTANVYATGGRMVSIVGGSGSAGAGGSTNSVQYNVSGVLAGDGNLTYNPVSKLFTVTNGNINTGNVNATGKVVASQLESNVGNGTAPLIVSSFTRVPNLSVAYANVSDFGVVTTTGSGNYYPVFVNGSTTGNYALGSNSAFTFNAATGALSATLLTGTLTTAAQPNVTSFGNATTITAAGNLNPSANVTYNLGNNTNRWNDLYLSGSTIFLGAQTIGANSTHVSISGILSANVSGAATTANTVVNNAQPNITSVGTLTSLAVTGNVTAGNLAGANLVSANFLTGTLTTAAQPNITSVGTLTSLSVTGTLSAGNMIVNPGSFQGSGNGIFNLNASNLSTGTVPAARLSGIYTIDIIGYASTVTTAAQPNITSVGTLTSLAVTGNITAGNVYANSGTIGASLLTGTLTTAAQPNITSVGTLTSLAVTGNVTSGNVYANSGTIGAGTILTTVLTTGANTTAGTITGNWSLSAGSQLTATYADLAEYYAGDQNYIPGTVLEFGGDKEVTLAGIESNKLAGVVSSDPAYVMNGDIKAEHPIIVALIGRVPVRVTGHVSKGDMLVSAGNGLAKSSILTPKIGTVIGKAIENKWTDGEGVVEVMVGRL